MKNKKMKAYRLFDKKSNQYIGSNNHNKNGLWLYKNSASWVRNDKIKSCNRNPEDLEIHEFDLVRIK